MEKGILKIATCQFAVGSSIKRNAAQIKKYMQIAADGCADVLHTPECALSGYVRTDFPSFENFNWQLLNEETQIIASLAKELSIWIVLGSVTKFSETQKPYNSLLLVEPDGKFDKRYDKRFCTKADLKKHTPGENFVFFKINSVKCSLLICFDVRFPEIYRHLYKKGVKCIFQSFYNARQRGASVHTHIMRQSMQCRAATNGFWASMSNSSGYYSPYPSCFIQPDGVIANQLNFNKPGVMINTVDINKRFYDPSADYRDIALNGKLNNAPD
ncbi:MAG: carbon-nitrogen hydrolase family protein [Phycisphaerae bacterium]|nr:carbon-nitrogen hydrolase family protein [Phycisphaerae bacterium]